MHSPTALTEQESLNLAGFFFARPCKCLSKTKYVVGGVLFPSFRASLCNEGD